MPTYAYRCADCGHAFDAQQSFTDDALTTCPECGGTLRKVFSSVGVVFKGSGFYRNDSRKSSKSTSGASSTSSSASSTASGSASSTSKDSSASSTTSASASSTPSTGGSTASSTGSAKAASS